MNRLRYPERLLAIGDIHGYRDKLDALLDRVRPTGFDKVVFIGDYIDRGPDSRGVIERLIDFRQQFPETIFLRGNHEQMLLDCYRHGNAVSCALFLGNGGKATLESYGGRLERIPEEHLDFIETTRFSHLETVAEESVTGERDFLFVHAGVDPNCPLDEQEPQDLLWIREGFITSPKPCGEIIVVHGHTPTADVPGDSPYRIAIDSGVYLQGPIIRNAPVSGGKLTCCNVLTRQIWQE